MFGKAWTESELAFLDRHYGSLRAGEIARRLDRSLPSVYVQAKTRGIARPNAVMDDRFEARLTELNAAGWTDTEIAALLKCDRHAITGRRKRLGLPSRAMNDRRIASIRAKTTAQCRAAGVSSLGEFRALILKTRAIKAGRPADLRWRSVQILELLESLGPMTRRQIADALGMPWKGSSKSLVSNDPEGSYLANLVARGLVVRLGRIVGGNGEGRNVNLYSASLAAPLQESKSCSP